MQLSNEYLWYILVDEEGEINVGFAFLDLEFIPGKEVDLVISEKVPGDEEKGFVPAYKYNIVRAGSNEITGKIDVRIGSNENLYYGGHIGYSITEKFRGNHFAAKACLLVKQVALAHGMEKLIITCNPDNFPSRKTCEYIGAKLNVIVELPPHNDMYLEGERQKCIFEWSLLS
ncbi:RimJ/RimL family protein N-acetyltransferase [Paenibacillus sp. V4I3]|uniref:GNAT family N-acetyltransferase n=1 Tax=unclassified Paenibacillus TaxID=185978 RepID=UPI002783BA77|nr:MULTISPECIES: GNAT family N-acetyltransferase [unclassified Paenibacillus]MDQ0875974.1 RimJ/RimL family protein N-acetyltransferase [Paenibacillus sp. V4I3]MDQ0888010.1 RimJ/RimL family protein N-acetyltransferase [Paenibacillus sp. V4I9]